MSKNYFEIFRSKNLFLYRQLNPTILKLYLECKCRQQEKSKRNCLLYFHTNKFSLDILERSYNEEARYNLATRIMSNGVEVIVAGDKSTLPGDPDNRRYVSTNRPVTLKPSTLREHMIMLLPQDASNVSFYLYNTLSIALILIFFRLTLCNPPYIQINSLQRRV